MKEGLSVAKDEISEQIFICNINDDKEEMYYDSKTKSYGIIKVKKTTSYKVAIATTVGYVILRSFSVIKIEHFLIYYLILSNIMGIGMGKLSNLIRKEDRLNIKKVILDRTEVKTYLKIGNEYLKVQKKGIIFLYLLPFFFSLLFLVTRDILSLAFIVGTWVFAFRYDRHMNIKARRRLYLSLWKDSKFKGDIEK